MKKLLITYAFFDGEDGNPSEGCTALKLTDELAAELLEHQDKSPLAREETCGEVWRAIRSIVALQGGELIDFVSAEALEEDAEERADLKRELEQRDRMIATLEAAHEQALTESELATIATALQNTIEDGEAAVGRLGANIIAAADEPDSEAFREAVRQYKAYANTLEVSRRLHQRVEAARIAAIAALAASQGLIPLAPVE